MKLTTCLMLFAFLQVGASGVAQRVSLNENNGSMEKVLKKIGQQTGYTFLYENRVLKKASPVTLKVNNASLEHALQLCFQGQPLTYKIFDRTVVIKEKLIQYTMKIEEEPEPLPLANIVTGKVTNTQGEAMVGVSVTIKGTKTGTLTDENGNYSIDVSANGNLVFSYVGYSAVEVFVNGRSSINVILEVADAGLAEVIVVGYGTQVKRDLTGAISTINSKELESVPVPTIIQSSIGRTPGLFGKIRSAQPGDYSGMDFSVRGFGNPLILIDGFEASKEEFLLLDPNDIQEFNILKDASAAAVYGARAGNGVIIVTTKRGRIQKPEFTYSGNISVQRLQMLPKAVNSAQYARFENIANENAGFSTNYTLEDIDKYLANNDPDFPNTNWWKLTLRDLAPETQHNLKVQGGTEKVKYFVSGGIGYQEGIYRSNSLKNLKYNLRNNLDVALTDKLHLGVDMSFLQENNIGPSWDFASDSAHWGINMMLFRSRPQYPTSYPDPTKPVTMGGDDPNPVTPTEIDQVGYKKYKRNYSDLKLILSYKLPFGFNIKGTLDYSLGFYDQKIKEKVAHAYWFDYDQNGNIQYHNNVDYNLYNSLQQNHNVDRSLNQQFILSWDRSYGEHDFNALLVYERLFNRSDWSMAKRIRYQFDSDFLFDGPTEDMTNDGLASHDGRIGQVFSFNYKFRNKYLLSFNGRRDGSPRFPENKRWGFFPSISAGWQMGDEEFIKDNLRFVNNLKLRISYGELGDDSNGQYQYLQSFSYVPSEIILNNEVLGGIRTNPVANLNVTWEKIKSFNSGVDFGIFNNKLTGSFDIFYRIRSNVLGNRQRSIPDVIGAIMPQENIERYSNRGFELDLNWRKTEKNGISWEVGGNFSFARERVESVDQAPFATQEAFRRNNQIGKWSDTRWGLPTDGVYLSADEIHKSGIIDQKGNATVNVGDIRYIDYNEDGVIDENDRIRIGQGFSPDIMFALHYSISWKGLSLGMLWQGAGLFDMQYGNADLALPFAGGNAPYLQMYENSFTRENIWGKESYVTRYPMFPTYYPEGYPTKNADFTSSFWTKSGTYLRLKNVQLDYNFAPRFIQNIGIKNINVYLSGYNVLTFSRFDFVDPEQQALGTGDYARALVYPSTSNYSFGVRATF